MKKVYALMIALLAGIGMSAQFNVTLQVDMTGQTVSANGVHVAGSFQNPQWQPNTTMMTNTTGNIYAVTVSVPAGYYEFKFLNGDTWGDVESVPAEVQVDLGTGNDNRWINVMSDTTYEAIMFSGAAPSGMVAFTTIVDMSLESSVEDTVSVAGSIFNPAWSPGSIILTDVKGDSVYRTITYVMPGANAEFKFLNGTAWGTDESVPSGCAQNNNRFANNIMSDTVYGPVCFGACASCFIPDTFNITFQADLTALCDTVDSVDIAGSLNAWGGGDMLTDPDGDGIYTISLDIPAGEIQYKVRYFSGGNTNWEGGGNKIHMLTKDTVLPVRCFGNDAYGACPVKPAPGDITLVVDVSTFPNPADLNDIYVIGDFTTPAWQSGKVLMSPVTGSPGLYEATFTGVCPAKISYKFMNVTATGTEQEEGFPNLMDSTCTEPSGTGSLNRFFVRPDDQAYTQSFKWDECTPLGIGIAEVEKFNFEIYPNPFSSFTTVSLDENGSFDLSIIDLTGAEVLKMEDVNGKVQINRGNMIPGIYLINILNENGAVFTEKLMVR